MTHLESIASSAVSLSSVLRRHKKGLYFLVLRRKLAHNLKSRFTFVQVRAAIKVKASVIICFTSSGRAARFLAFVLP